MQDYVHDPRLGTIVKDISEKNPILEDSISKNPVELDTLLKTKMKVEAVKV